MVSSGVLTNSKQHSKPTGKGDEMAESIAERVAWEVVNDVCDGTIPSRQVLIDYAQQRIQAAIDEAVLAERARCAGIAEEWSPYCAEAIRSRTVGAPTSKP